MSGRVLALCALATSVAAAQTLTTLTVFHPKNGARPIAPVIQGLDGDLYGTTDGNEKSMSTVFRISRGGKLTTLAKMLHSTPYGGLTLATGGNYYGTTVRGGPGFLGTIFKITARGKLSTVHTFTGTDGANPPCQLIQATDGNFYGTTDQEGANRGGTIFRITPAGKLTTLYNFCSLPNCADGSYPEAGLVEAADGDFYGTTEYGGTSPGCQPDYGCGTAFKITRTGEFTTLHNFCAQPNCSDGANPTASLIQAADGNLYGTTATRGNASGGGTAFRLTTTGALTTIYSFCGQPQCPDGIEPNAGLVQATDGNLYGATIFGGLNNGGTLFRITPGGTLTTLYSFCKQRDCAGGKAPYGTPVQATDGNFYGTTFYGRLGTVYKLAVGLGPFVKTLPASGKAGSVVTILRTKLAGASSVTFNGQPAAFTVNHKGSAISTAVPAGATTGSIQVVVPSGTLTSNAPFRIRE